MGSLRLECPLCCSETFPTPLSLKYHLLNMMDNLLCTVCGKKCNTVRALAEHLGSECKVNKTTEPVPAEEEEADADQPTVEAKDEVSKDEDEENKSNESEMDVDESEDIDVKTEVDENGTEEVYYCSTCAISFNSVEKHLKEFHEGQEVFLEDGSGSQDNPQLIPATENAEDADEEPLLQTIQEEECTDKMGRLYTRKVVQIEKFWDSCKDDPETDKDDRPEPVVQYFSINNGIAVKIEKDELEGFIHAGDDENTIQVFQCSVCLVHFTKESQYNTHKCSSAKFDCTECETSFTQKRSLSAHMRMHNTKKTVKTPKSAETGLGEGPFLCTFCNTPFNTYKSLKLHQRMHDPIKSKEVEPPVNYGIMGEVIDMVVPTGARAMFTCNICNKEYDESYRSVHMKSHSGEDNFDCEICNRKFFTQSNLEMHMRVHTAELTHTCSYCKKVFPDYKQLQEHIKEHLGARPYQCQYCTRRFVRPHEKVKHERIHTGEKPHICDVCGKAFRVSYCLTLHMRTHSGTRPYQCPECGKRFKAHSVYNHHLLIHSSERKYKCPYCPKAFKTAVQLAGHKNTHTKPFTCTECNRPFASLYAVRSHMETHKLKNNLKYNCFVCGASYARAFALRDHVKAHHAEETWAEADLDSAATASIITEADGTEEIQNVLILDEDALIQDVQMID